MAGLTGLIPTMTDMKFRLRQCFAVRITPI